MKYDYSQEVANEMLENADNENDRLSSELLEWQGKYGIEQAEVDILLRQRDEFASALDDIARLWEDSDRGHTNAYDMRCVARTVLAKFAVTP